jgi:D-3-phosphoglycerate dehydrogenase / 2-oxoglutarate reductase
MKTFLYEKFENKQNFIKLKKNYDLINLTSKRKYNKNSVSTIYSRFSKNLSKNFLSQFKNLKIIISPTTGLNHIDVKYCNKNKIKLINLKKNNHKLKKISSTSEMALSMILAAVRKLPYYYKNNFKLSERYKYETYQFKNYTIGIIGCGRIGKKLFNDLKYLKFNVFFYDINRKITKDISYLNLMKLLKISDVVSLNLNYTSENINFFNKKLFNQCKKNLIFVNTARGEVVNELDLLNFLKKNKLSSAYLDVIKDETTGYKKNILYKYSRQSNNLFITPHLGGSTKDALKDTENIVIQQLMKINRIK